MLKVMLSFGFKVQQGTGPIGQYSEAELLMREKMDILQERVDYIQRASSCQIDIPDSMILFALYIDAAVVNYACVLCITIIVSTYRLRLNLCCCGLPYPNHSNSSE